MLLDLLSGIAILATVSATRYSLHIEPVGNSSLWPLDITAEYYKNYGIGSRTFGIVNSDRPLPGNLKIASFDFVNVTTTTSGYEMLMEAHIDPTDSQDTRPPFLLLHRRGSHEFYGAGRGVSTSEEGRALAIYQPQSVIWWNDNNTLVPIVRRRDEYRLTACAPKAWYGELDAALYWIDPRDSRIAICSPQDTEVRIVMTPI